MKILVLNYEFPPLGGGASPVSYEIAKGYVKRGHKVDVVTMGFRKLPSFELKDGIRIHRVRCWRKKQELSTTPEMFTFLLPALIKSYQLHREKQFDINHTHFIIPTGIVSYCLKNLTGLRYIITSHGSDIPGHNKGRFTKEHKFTKPILRLVLNNAKAACAGSFYLASLADSNIGARKKYTVVREGFDSKRFIPQKKRRTIVTSGRLLSTKGFQYLIEAFRQLDTDYHLHILGDGPMMEELKVLSHGDQRIIFHGWIDNTSEKFKKILESASIYCLLSEGENSSVALLEAMSAGCASVATNVSGCLETVSNSGILVEPKNVSQVKKVLTNLIGTPNLIKEMGNMARKRVEEVYNWEKTVKDYERILQ